MDTVAKRSSEVRKRIGMWSEMLVRQTKEHPARSIGVALGAGYLVGGGLFSGLTARMLGTGMRIGLRMALIPFMTQTIVELGKGLLMQGAGARDDEHDDDDDGSSHPHSEARTDQRHPDKKET